MELWIPTSVCPTQESAHSEREEHAHQWQLSLGNKSVITPTYLFCTTDWTHEPALARQVLRRWAKSRPCPSLQVVSFEPVRPQGFVPSIKPSFSDQPLSQSFPFCCTTNKNQKATFPSPSLPPALSALLSCFPRLACVLLANCLLSPSPNSLLCILRCKTGPSLIHSVKLNDYQYTYTVTVTESSRSRKMFHRVFALFFETGSV